MRCTKYMPALRELGNRLANTGSRSGGTSRGERIMASLFPNRGTGWPSK